MSSFIQNINDNIKRNKMLSKGDKVLVAVSGGPDSICLLHVLFRVKNKLGIDIFVANMDHCIRGKRSEKDSEYVKDFTEKLGLEFVHERIDITKIKDKKKSIEEKAREKRYGFLFKAAEKAGCKVIATGHTMDDQAETVMLRILAGASLKGLTGIPCVRIEKGIKIIRPLIKTTKKDILAYLAKEKIDFCDDHTNRETKYLRNSVRLKVLPFLEKYNPRIRRTLANLGDTLREDLEFIEESREKSFKPLNKSGSSLSIGLSELLIQPKALRKQIFKELFSLAGGNVKKLTYRHWTSVDDFVINASKGKSLDLPGKIKVLKEKNKLIFSKCGK